MVCVFQESEAFAFYNKALGLQRAGDVEGADRVFKSLVKHPFLQDVRFILLNGHSTSDIF